MTPVSAAHPQMPAEDFEDLARHAPETVTLECDRREKRDGHAAGIPVYLLVDRDAHALTVHSEPRNGSYRERRTIRTATPWRSPPPSASPSPRSA